MSKSKSEPVVKIRKPIHPSKKRLALFRRLNLRHVRTAIRPDGIPVLEVKRDD